MHFSIDPLWVLAMEHSDLLVLTAAVQEAEEIRRRSEEQMAKQTAKG